MYSPFVYSVCKGTNKVSNRKENSFKIYYKEVKFPFPFPIENKNTKKNPITRKSDGILCSVKQCVCLS